jgi:glycosyltransferase involved in cell wall biosynthesis
MVVSAVNFTEGGPLTILREFVAAACETLPLEWNIVVFVHKQGLLEMERPRYIEVPAAKKSWLYRLYVEWFAFAAYAKKLRPDLWVSLHDITPRIGAIRQAVYCHNPMPFYRLRLREMWLEPRSILYKLFYSILYRVNIGRNAAIVVQQSWMREQFRSWVSAATKIIVSHPVVDLPSVVAESTSVASMGGATFLYPALPRVFKNIEIICRAARELEGGGRWRSKIVLTIDGTENRYARWLRRHFGDLRTVRFAGRQTREQMSALYRTADCLLFPSLLETWGLPITEAKRFGMPMLVADLPYAHETVGNYDCVDFIDVYDFAELGRRMLAFQETRSPFGCARRAAPVAPFAADWRELLSLLVEDSD